MFKRTRSFFNKRAVKTKTRVRQVLNIDEMVENKNTIQRTFQQLTQPRVGREETFSNAYRRLNLDEAKLAQSHRYHSIRFYIFSIFGTIALGTFLFALIRGSWFSLAPSFGAMALLSALVFQASFVLYQIERRSLVSTKEWLHHPRSWIPAPFQPVALSSSTALRPR
jgi:hypothetical protein